MSHVNALRAYVDTIWTEGKVQQLGDFVHPECRFSDPYGDTRLHGVTAVQESIRQWFQIFDDHSAEILQHATEGDNVAWQWRIVARFSNSAPAGYLEGRGRVWPRGQECVIAGTTFSRFEDGLIIYEETQSDTRGLIEQMGYRLS